MPIERAEALPSKPNLRPADIAKFLDISLTTVYSMIQDGGLPAFKIGGHYRIPREKFLQWYKEVVVNGQD